MELELKLLVAPADQRKVARLEVVRRLTSGPVRSRQLNNIYFDTPDLALAADDVALRLREIPGRRGSTWVQTLKEGGSATGGMHQREELEWPVPGRQLDLALIDASPFAAHFRKPRVRDALRPVFNTDFRRSARQLRFPDGTTAELAMDTGAIRAGRRTEPIAEIELELVSGDPKRLFELAEAVMQAVPARLGHASKAERGYRLAHGLRIPPPQKARPIDLDADMATATGLARVLGACLAQMQANEAGVLAGRHPEHLHQFRVGLRRLRSAVSLAALAVGRETVAPLAGELRWLGGELNGARDWDVFVTETFPPLAASFTDVAGLEALHRVAVRLRAGHNRSARAALGSARYQALLLALGRLLCRGDLAAWRGAAAAAPADATAAAVPTVHPLDVPLETFAAGVLQKRDRKLRKRGDAVPEATPEARHEVRIAAKKLRYAAEFFAALHPRKRVTAYAKALAGVQDILGALNDAAVVDRLLAEAGARAPLAPEATGLVRGWFAATAMHELGRFGDAWSAFADQKPYWR